MVKVHGHGNWRITVLPDQHVTPHFHIWQGTGPGALSVSVEIATMRLLTPKGGPFPRWTNEAMEWAKANQSVIQAKWDEITEGMKG